jgi:hypothetical protein
MQLTVSGILNQFHRILQGVLFPALDEQLLDRLSVDVSLRRICGWESRREIPHESQFSRAFAEFAASELPPTFAPLSTLWSYIPCPLPGDLRP